MQIQAHIRPGRIRAKGSFSPDAVDKLNLQGTEDAFTFDAHVLLFDEILLNANGFLAGRIISDLREKGHGSYFIYGSHRNQNGKRHHVLVRDVPRELILESWEIAEWLGNDLITI